MAHIFVPANSVKDWKKLLADPIKHWRTGYSAKALAYCWQEAGGIPSHVMEILSQINRLNDLEPIFIVPEHQVPLPGGSRPSQNDIWVLARTSHGLVSITVEGKVSEPFGPTVQEWLHDSSLGKEQRLQFLCSKLALSYPPPDEVRYQLFHRTASAVIEAERFQASDAVMIVHSFSQTNESFQDFERFVELYNVKATVDQAVTVKLNDEMNLHFAWVHGPEKYRRI